MGLTDSHSIEKEIDSYFMTKGASDFNIYKDSFTQRCASLIWESFCRHYDFSHIYGNAAKNVNDFIEALKEFPYSDTIHIETIDTDPHVYLVQLKNGKWYLHEGSWYYFAVPLWNEMPRYLPNNIDIHDEAELMLAFDEYIPQIQARAEEIVLKHKEQQTACEIIRASAEGLINLLINEGRISLEREPTISCRTPDMIDIGIGRITWIVGSLEELKTLLLRRYGTE